MEKTLKFNICVIFLQFFMQKKAFTLIEILVAITIFSIFMISMIMIYASSANTDRKIDINRTMQENTKNIIETIAEDIRKNWISWVSMQKALDSCDFNYNNWLYKQWDKLCVWDFSYYLAIKIWWVYNRVDSSEMDVKCSDLKNECILVKDDGISITRLSNSRVKFKNLKFLVSDKYIPKVTIVYEMQPSIKKGVKAETIKNSKLNIQTTITSRIIKTN